jgi:hypothetical protein
MIRLPPNAIWAGAGVIADLGEAFSVFMADKDEVTLVMPLDAWQEEYQRRLPGAVQTGAFRLITSDYPLEFALVGFMAIVARALAEANVSLMALSAFSRDHFLVPAEAFERAWAALKTAQQSNPPGENP